jgi:protein TonB
MRALALQMSSPDPEKARASEPRIVDAVFGHGPKRSGGRLIWALAIGVGIHVASVLWTIRSAPSLEEWSAELATRVHAELTREEVIDLPPTPPKTEKPPTPPAAAPPAPQQPIVRFHRAPSQAPPSPAQAGQIVAADPAAPVDLPGTTFVTGTAKTYAGGVTASTGKSQVAVTGPVASSGSPSDGRVVAAQASDDSAPVSIAETNWNCPWPKEADSREVDEESVVIKVVVRADGKAESVKTLSDPGYGFAQAARTCALETRFSPARDRAGHEVRAESPPIRVHFSR